MSVIGVPIKVLHEAEGHIVTVETTTGEVGIITNNLIEMKLYFVAFDCHCRDHYWRGQLELFYS